MYFFSTHSRTPRARRGSQCLLDVWYRCHRVYHRFSLEWTSLQMPQTSISQHCGDLVRSRQAEWWATRIDLTPVRDQHFFLLSHWSIRGDYRCCTSKAAWWPEHFRVLVMTDIIRAIHTEQACGSTGNGKGPEPHVWIDCFSTEMMSAGIPWQLTILFHCFESVARFFFKRGKHRVLRE